jgi:hypothetical protein
MKMLTPTSAQAGKVAQTHAAERRPYQPVHKETNKIL